MFDNIVPQIVADTGLTHELDANLKLDDSSVKVTLVLDDSGLTVKTKKDNVHFARSEWLDIALVGNVLVFMLNGIQYSDWSKKRKFEKKNPSTSFTDFTPLPQTYAFELNPKKLPDGTTLATVNEQTRRTYLLAYLDEVENPTVIRCEDCNKMMDITGYQTDGGLFCENCSRVMGRPDDDSHGICNGCGYYTKLVIQNSSDAGEGQETISTERTCHRCRVSGAVWGFVYGVGTAVAVGLLNLGTLFFVNRYFPVLILIAAVALLWSLFNLVLVIIYSLARKAAGETPLENATNALRKGKTDQAMEIINSMQGDMTGNPGILLNLSRGLMTAGDYDKAEQFSQILMANFPNFVAGYQENLEVQIQKGCSEEEANRLTDEALTVAARNDVRTLRRQKLLTEVPV